jgi:sialate O-acetylesterase
MKKIILLALFVFAFGNTYSQKTNNKYWNNKKCSVVLTYDDATNGHLDYALPVLDSLNLKVTFYVPGHSNCLYERIDEWKAVAKEGHELGNHTIYHPCHGKSMGRKWVSPNHDLDDYSVQQFLDEIRIQNTLLRAVDGKTERTFAYTCGDLNVAGKDIAPYMKDYFLAARDVQPGMNYQDKVDLFRLKIFGVHNEAPEILEAQVEKAKKEGALLIFLFHGVGEGIPFSATYENHKEFVKYLKKNEKDIWVAPMVEVAKFIKEKQGNKS